jgi:transposase InsO family protein
VIGLSSSTYYQRPKIPREERERADTELRDQIERVQCEYGAGTGYRYVQHYLRRSGIVVGERKIRRIMKKYSLHAKLKRAFVVTTDSEHAHRVYPNLLPQRTVRGLNEVWTADLTYIRLGNGFVYLAVILDLYSRKVIGWHVSRQIDGELALSALKMAIAIRRPEPGCIHHSDRGVQYLCDAYVALLKEHGFWISNSAKGNPYDNAWTERFMRTLKQEEVYLANYETYLDVIENLPAFIEDVYNERRIHSRLGYLTPNEFEAKVLKNPSDPNNRRFDLLL